jgi:hypothetical protein
LYFGSLVLIGNEGGGLLNIVHLSSKGHKDDDIIDILNSNEDQLLHDKAVISVALGLEDWGEIIINYNLLPPEMAYSNGSELTP